VELLHFLQYTAEEPFDFLLLDPKSLEKTLACKFLLRGEYEILKLPLDNAKEILDR
jgi:hypothetical protein